MAGEGTYDDFEQQLTERLTTIAEEIAEAKRAGRLALKDPTDRVGRVLAAQQIKIKNAERSRVAAMLAGIQAQKSELSMRECTTKYVQLMKTSSKLGPNLTEDQANSVIRAYESRIEGSNSVSTLLLDSADDAFEMTIEASDSALPGERADDAGYADLFGAEPELDAARAPSPVPPTGSGSSGPDSGGLALLDLPSVPSDPVGARSAAAQPAVPVADLTAAQRGNHRRSHSRSETGNALGFLLS